jgi:hypothetical protein
MADWAGFSQEAPQLAALAKERFDRTGVILLGTLRKDGWPRISPVEPFVVDGELFLTMMWRSTKALDLLRDPRCVVHGVITSREGNEGEVKLYGSAEDVEDLSVRERVADVVEEAIQWRPPLDRCHYFRVDIRQAAHVLFGEGDAGQATVKVWRQGRPGVSEFVRTV